MDDFKRKSLEDYGWELSISNEYGKNKVQKEQKKRFRKLSRTRLKRNLIKEIGGLLCQNSMR